MKKNKTGITSAICIDENDKVGVLSDEKTQKRMKKMAIRVIVEEILKEDTYEVSTLVKRKQTTQNILIKRARRQTATGKQRYLYLSDNMVED